MGFYGLKFRIKRDKIAFFGFSISFSMSHPYADRVRGELLREWRVSQRWEVATLATQSNLSVAQILQLEGGGDSLFYTPAIKESAARKVARLLGGDPAAVLRPLDDELPCAEPETIPDVALYRQPSVSSRQASVFYRQPGLIAGPILAVVAVVSASGWLQQKWQEGGSQQFWRERSSAVAVDAAAPPAGLAKTELTVASAEPSSANEVAANGSSAWQSSAMVAQVVEPVQSRPSPAGLCSKTEPDTVLVPSRPSKSGDMVYLVAQKDGAVCVVDATGTSTVMALKTHETRTVYGPPPWRVHFEQPQQVQLYFQGVRLRLPETQVTTLALKEGSTSY